VHAKAIAQTVIGCFRIDDRAAVVCAACRSPLETGRDAVWDSDVVLV